ncbi:hypothetical protein HDV57DRAFT_409036 [Trichoderma longibrachiatum]|uniref:Uncharacterized protein n=1 Tax=Trichoderma longibrachiatum ATCC 18648 TaxID=983965 RepID=A0A2T4C2H5_TRILO|nr:hypothetical protein M440DRAFT_328125 [Trichoderma longibrachiatum ATCC 18648]
MFSPSFNTSTPSRDPDSLSPNLEQPSRTLSIHVCLVHPLGSRPVASCIPVSPPSVCLPEQANPQHGDARLLNCNRLSRHRQLERIAACRTRGCITIGLADQTPNLSGIKTIISPLSASNDHLASAVVLHMYTLQTCSVLPHCMSSRLPADASLLHPPRPLPRHPQPRA